MAATVSRRKLARYAAKRISEGDIEVVVRELAAYLVETRRVREADLVVRDIESELADTGTVLATVTTAHQLTDELRRAVDAIIGGKTANVKEVIDPAVIGGVKVELPGKVYDATIRHRLESLKELTLT